MWLYLLLFILSLIGTYFTKQIALNKNIIDVPNERSSHKKPTPKGGGIAIALTWYAAITYIYFFSKQDISSDLYYALLSGVGLVIIGIFDDLIDISPKLRLAIQILSALAALFFLGGLEKINLGFINLEYPILLSIIAFIFIIWFINLFNFMDGIDGYIGSEVFFISIIGGILVNSKTPWILAACVLGFLILNWQPAKIFMGDVGSTLLGFNIAIFAIYFQNKEQASFLLWIMLSSVFWLDATITIFRRFRNKENLLQAHRKHAYQRIVQYGFSHQKTVLFTIVINCIISGLVFLSNLFKEYILLFFILNLSVLYFFIKFIDKKKTFKSS